MILHYSLAILNTNDYALSLLVFANAPMSDSDSVITMTLNQCICFAIVFSVKRVKPDEFTRLRIL